MKFQATHTWSYHVVSKKQLNFYHVLVAKIDLVDISSALSYAQSVKKEKDGSVTVTLCENGHLQETIQELSLFFKRAESTFVETPDARIVTPSIDQFLIKEWYFSIMGAVALTLINDPLLKSTFTGKWEYVDSRIFTLFVQPYTFIFTRDRVKIIHPVRPQNYALREHAERVAATAFSKVVTRISEAYPGCEGLAILSYVNDKLDVSSDYFISLVESKSDYLKPHERYIKIS